MSCQPLQGNGAMSTGAICGGYRPMTKTRPKDWFEHGYTIMVPFKFKWRAKIGKVECTCKQVIENFQPWYGFTWDHQNECALMQQLEKRPQLGNLPAYQNLPMIAQSE